MRLRCAYTPRIRQRSFGPRLVSCGYSDCRHRLPIETLLLDEGFGTLDPRSLDQAMQALEALQAGGARVGIISHVGALTERVAARVRVEQSEGGRSRLVVE